MCVICLQLEKTGLVKERRRRREEGKGWWWGRFGGRGRQSLEQTDDHWNKLPAQHQLSTFTSTLTRKIKTHAHTHTHMKTHTHTDKTIKHSRAVAFWVIHESHLLRHQNHSLSSLPFPILFCLILQFNFEILFCRYCVTSFTLTLCDWLTKWRNPSSWKWLYVGSW